MSFNTFCVFVGDYEWGVREDWHRLKCAHSCHNWISVGDLHKSRSRPYDIMPNTLLWSDSIVCSVCNRKGQL
jgi:hypothetical protein